MKPQSAKAKGRSFQQGVARAIQEKFNLPEEDVVSRPMGSQGIDIMLSDRARGVFPFAVECTKKERLNLWDKISQAWANRGELIPILVFSRNRAKTYVIIELDDFLDLL